LIIGIKILNKFQINIRLKYIKVNWGLGIGDWGLGIGDWGFGAKTTTP